MGPPPWFSRAKTPPYGPAKSEPEKPKKRKTTLLPCQNSHHDSPPARRKSFRQDKGKEKERKPRISTPYRAGKGQVTPNFDDLEESEKEEEFLLLHSGSRPDLPMTLNEAYRQTLLPDETRGYGYDSNGLDKWEDVERLFMRDSVNPQAEAPMESEDEGSRSRFSSFTQGLVNEMSVDRAQYLAWLAYGDGEFSSSKTSEISGSVRTIRPSAPIQPPAEADEPRSSTSEVSAQSSWEPISSNTPSTDIPKIFSRFSIIRPTPLVYPTLEEPDRQRTRNIRNGRIYLGKRDGNFQRGKKLSTHPEESDHSARSEDGRSWTKRKIPWIK